MAWPTFSAHPLYGLLRHVGALPSPTMKPCGLSKSSVQMSVVVYLQYDASISVPMALSALCNLLDFLAASPVSSVGGASPVVPPEFHPHLLIFSAGFA